MIFVSLHKYKCITWHIQSVLVNLTFKSHNRLNLFIFLFFQNCAIVFIKSCGAKDKSISKTFSW